MPQSNVLGPFLFLNMIIDIDKSISPSSKLVSFDLNYVDDWAHVNNMFFNAQKFDYVSLNGSMTPCGSNVYTNLTMEIISPSRNVLDLGI